MREGVSTWMNREKFNSWNLLIFISRAWFVPIAFENRKGPQRDYKSTNLQGLCFATPAVFTRPMNVAIRAIHIYISKVLSLVHLWYFPCRTIKYLERMETWLFSSEEAPIRIGNAETRTYADVENICPSLEAWLSTLLKISVHLRLDCLHWIGWYWMQKNS